MSLTKFRDDLRKALNWASIDAAANTSDYELVDKIIDAPSLAGYLKDATSTEEKVDEIHAAIKNIERVLVEDLAPMVGPALKGLEPVLGKLNGPMGAILGSMLK